MPGKGHFGSITAILACFESRMGKFASSRAITGSFGPFPAIWVSSRTVSYHDSTNSGQFRLFSARKGQFKTN